MKLIPDLEEEKLAHEKRINALFEKIAAFIEIYGKIIKLEVRTNAAKGLSALIIISILLVFFSFTFLFLSIGFAFMISELLGIAYFWGFFGMSLMYFLMVLGIFQRKAWLTARIDAFLDDQLQNMDKP
jgi:hypothetical protein